MNDCSREVVTIKTTHRDVDVARYVPHKPANGKLSVLFCEGADRGDNSRKVYEFVRDIVLSRGVTLIHMQQPPVIGNNSADNFYDFAQEISTVANCMTLLPQDGKSIIVGAYEGATIVSVLANKLQKKRFPGVYALDPTLPAPHDASMESQEEYLRTLAAEFGNLATRLSEAPHVYSAFSRQDHSHSIMQYMRSNTYVLKPPRRNPIHRKCGISHGIKSLKTAVHCMVGEAMVRQ